MRRALVVTVVCLLAGAGRAEASSLLPQAVPMRSAVYMADHWAAEPYWKPHTLACWRIRVGVRCRVFYSHIAEPVTFDDSGRAYGTWLEHVTIRRRDRHHLVLRSDSFRGRLVRRG